MFFINGFLEAGKTTYIKQLIRDDSANVFGRILIIACEEGEVEYDVDKLSDVDIDIEYIEDRDDFNDEYLTGIENKYNPDCIIVEFNGMWDKRNIEIPWHWKDIIETTIFDASTFKLYAKNMRSHIAEHVRSAGTTIFNRCDIVRNELPVYTRNIKAINRN